MLAYEVHKVHKGKTKLLFELLFSWSSRNRCRFLVMIFVASILVGWYVNCNMRGLYPDCSVGVLSGFEMGVAQGAGYNR